MKCPVTEKTFELEVKNRFSVLQDEQELTIDTFNHAMHQSGMKVLGYNKKKREHWISSDIGRTINDRETTKGNPLAAKSQRLKEQLETKYSDLDREVKKRIRTDTKVYVDKLADKIR